MSAQGTQANILLKKISVRGFFTGKIGEHEFNASVSEVTELDKYIEITVFDEHEHEEKEVVYVKIFNTTEPNKEYELEKTKAMEICVMFHTAGGRVETFQYQQGTVNLETWTGHPLCIKGSVLVNTEDDSARTLDVTFEINAA